MAITRPSAVIPRGALRESPTFLLPLVAGQVETLLTTRVVLTTSTSRDLISLQRKLLACPIFSDYVIERIQWGPGGNAPIDWCHVHGITDPLSVLEVRQHYYDHSGGTTTDLRVGSSHLETAYFEKYGPLKPLQIQQFIKGEKNKNSLTLAQDNADSIRAA